MCGSLKLEYEGKVNPGGTIPASNLEAPGSRESYTWSGFARTDGAANGTKTMAEQWNSEEWKATVLKISGFTEKGTMIPARRIGVIISEKARALKILTRPARTDYEQGLHNRWPSRIPSKTSPTEYTIQLNRVTKGQYKLAS